MSLDVRPTTRRRATVGFAIATVLVGVYWWAKRTERTERASPPPQDSAAVSVAGTADSAAPDGPLPDLAAAPQPASPAQPLSNTLPRTCAELAEHAVDGGPDAVLLTWLCPEHPLNPVTARAVLLAARSAQEAAALVDRLEADPAMQGLAKLVAQGPRPPVYSLPDPAKAIVSPVDDAVLDHVQLAHALVATPGVALADRTRARAYLAKVYLQATQQLGVGVGRPADPFARLLAGRALHYGRKFCLAYWRSRVAGLAGLFGEIETRLLDLVLALQSGAHHGDAARLAVELTDTRHYLLREGPRGRITRRLAERTAPVAAVDELASDGAETKRLLHLGFVDMTLSATIAQGRDAEGPGMLAVEQWLRDELARAERGEYSPLLDRRLARARARTPPPPEEGPATLDPTQASPWPSATAIADEAVTWIERAPEHGLPRAYALGHALLLVRPRPDALVVLIDRATDDSASAPLRASTSWLLAELEARDDGRRSWQQRAVAADTIDPATALDDEEAARRRRFALRLRMADRFGRGAGLRDTWE